MRLIPTFTADGDRWRDSSREAVARWLAAHRVVATRNRHGAIVSVQFRAKLARTLTAPHTGTRFVYREQLGEGMRLWQHHRRALGSN